MDSVSGFYIVANIFLVLHRAHKQNSFLIFLGPGSEIRDSPNRFLHSTPPPPTHPPPPPPKKKNIRNASLLICS